MTNPLLRWLRLATADEKASLADGAETTVGYLYQLAGDPAHRRRPNVVMAVRIEAATRAISRKNKALHVVTANDLARLFA